MINTENYIAEWKACINENRTNVSEELVDQFNEFMVSVTDSYLAAYENKDLERINELLKGQRKLRREITKMLQQSQDQLLIISGKIVQSYNLFNKLYQAEREKSELNKQLYGVLKAYPKMEDILHYLYKNNFSRHVDIATALSIPKSTLTYNLNILEEKECVEKIGSGKHASYTLTNIGRKYVAENIKIEDVVYDPETFLDGSRKILQNKAEYMAHRDINKFADERRYNNVYVSCSNKLIKINAEYLKSRSE